MESNYEGIPKGCEETGVSPANPLSLPSTFPSTFTPPDWMVAVLCAYPGNEQIVVDVVWRSEWHIANPARKGNLRHMDVDVVGGLPFRLLSHCGKTLAG